MKTTTPIIRAVILGLLFVLTADGMLAQTIDRAHRRLRAYDYNDALEEYTDLVDEAVRKRNQTKGVDPILIAEYAYALALAHVYDVSLVYLDEALCNANALHKQKKIEEVNFYVSEVLLLMKYDSLAVPFQRHCKPPIWISLTEIQALRETRRTAPIISREEFKTTLARINNLIRQQGFIQALVLSEELTFFYKNQYFSTLETATIWSKLGFFDLAYINFQKVKELSCINHDTIMCEVATQNAFSLEKSQNDFFLRHKLKYEPRLLLYAGGFFSLSNAMLNTRFGFYNNRQFSASINFSYAHFYESKDNTYSIGLSAYQRCFNMLSLGVGVNNQFRNGDYALYVTPTIGLSFYKPRTKTSIDLFYNLSIPCVGTNAFQHNISLGFTSYF